MASNNLKVDMNTSINIYVKKANQKDKIPSITLYSYISFPINLFIRDKKLMGDTIAYTFHSILGYADPALNLKNCA